MKKYVNGRYAELTPEEEAALRAAAADAPVPEPTMEDRMEALESAMLEMLGVSL